MKIIYYLMQISMACFDLSCFILLIINSNFNIIVFSLLHSLIIALNWRLNPYFREQNTLFYCFSILLPGIGLLLTGVIGILLREVRINSGIITDYEEYLKVEAERLERLDNISVEEEVNLLTIRDQLKYADSEDKKETIIKFNLENISLKVDVLQEALEDQDPEVVHYAASTLNSIEEELVNSIEKLREDYIRTNETKYLGKLIKVYQQYIYSGLIAEELAATYIKDYLTILETANQRFGEVEELNLKIARAYNQLGNYQQVVNLLTGLLKDQPEQPGAYINLMKAYYYLGQVEEVISLAHKANKLDLDFSKSEQELVDFWS